MSARIAVIGTGYVGLTTGVCLADLGHTVVCADIDADKVARLSAGELPIVEDGLSELLASGLASGRLSFVVGAAAAAPTTNERRPDARPEARSSESPSSTMGNSPADSRATLSASMSAHTTVWPRSAKHTPVVRPTYPVPITAMRADMTSQATDRSSSRFRG